MGRPRFPLGKTKRPFLGPDLWDGGMTGAVDEQRRGALLGDEEAAAGEGAGGGVAGQALHELHQLLRAQALLPAHPSQS